ncbi:MAG: hypothetical protein ACHQ50_07755 [Fimbriimonadales bacterium]
MRTRALLWAFVAAFALLLALAVNWALRLGLPPALQPQPGDLAINPEGTIIARTGGALPGKTVIWYRISDAKNVHSSPNGVADIPHLIVRNTTICVWSPYGQISVFDAERPSQVVHLQARSFGNVALSPSGRLLAYEIETPYSVAVAAWRSGKTVAAIPGRLDSLCFMSEDAIAYWGDVGAQPLSMYNYKDDTNTKTTTGHAFHLTPLFGSQGVVYSDHSEGRYDRFDMFRWVWGREPERLFSWQSEDPRPVAVEGGILLTEHPQFFRPWRLQAVLVDMRGTPIRRFSFSSPVVRICTDRTGKFVYGLSEDGSVLQASTD